jgi:hypothetical protein
MDVSNNKVYICGYEALSKTTAKTWIDKEGFLLTIELGALAAASFAIDVNNE